MLNAAARSDELAETQRSEEGDGLHQAQHDDLNIMMAMEDGIQVYQSSKQELEEHGVDGVLQRAQRHHLSSENTMHVGYGDSVRTEQLKEEGLDDDLHGGNHSFLNSKKKTQEEFGDGLHATQQRDLSCKRTMKEDCGDGGQSEKEASHEDSSSTASVLPQPVKTTIAENHHDSCVLADSSNFGSSSDRHNQYTTLHDELDDQANLSAYGTSAQQRPETATSAEDSEDDADQNLGAHGGDDTDQNLGAHDRSREYLHAAYMASFGMLGEHMHENEAPYDTVGTHEPKTRPASGMAEQQAFGNIIAKNDLNVEAGQPGRSPHNTMFANGNVGESEQECACDDSFKNGDFKGGVYDYTSANNESDATGHEKMTAHDENGGDFKIDLNQDASSVQAPPFTNSTVKSGSFLSGSLYYTKQSASMKNAGLVLRFGSAIFSLIAFSVIISTNEQRFAAGSTFYVKFSDYQAYNYLTALNLLSFLYSSAQLVLLAQARSNRILSSPVKWGASVYLCDQMLAFLMISSSSSAATASELSRHGLRNIWPPACSTWKLSFFCSKAEVAVGLSFISFLFMLLSSFSSGYNLSNLLAE